MKIRLYKFFIRLKTCYKILFVYKHWFLTILTREQLVLLLKGDNFEIKMMKHGLHEYNIICIAKSIAETKDDIDMMLEKAKFQAESELFKTKK